MMHRVMPVRGLAHELRITQSFGTPGFIDSSSTVFIARDQAAPKRSIWILRRSAVLQESKEQGDIDPLKIDEHDNVADDQTKPVSHATFVRHLRYTHNVLDSPDVLSPPPSPPDSEHGSPPASDMSEDDVINGVVLDAYVLASDDDSDGVEDVDEWGALKSKSRGSRLTCTQRQLTVSRLMCCGIVVVLIRLNLILCRYVSLGSPILNSMNYAADIIRSIGMCCMLPMAQCTTVFSRTWCAMSWTCAMG